MLTRAIPSMFMRRILLLGILVAVATVLPTVQLWNLTIRRGDALLAEAERRMVAERWLPTQRGRILDRKGRVLAYNRPSFDIAVDYEVISGQWALRQAGRAARQRNAGRWSEMSRAERRAAAEYILPEFEAQLDAAWLLFAQTAGAPFDEVQHARLRVHEQVERMARHNLEARMAARRRELEERGRPVPDEATLERQLAQPIREQRSAHVILRGVDDRTAFAFHRLLPPESRQASSAAGRDGPVFPGLRIVDSDVREYPLHSTEVAIDRSSFPAGLRRDEPMTVRVDGVATHIIGWMRSRIYREDELARPRHIVETLPDGTERIVGIDRGHYQEGDSIGHSGLEAALERPLRGMRGLELEHLDSGEKEVQPPEFGRDIPLTIDIMLQARIQALFDPALGLTVNQPWHENPQLNPGEALTGAAVVIDVDSGEILALVTHPSFTLEELRRDPRALIDDKLNMPHINRAVAKPYQPGSIVKPLMFVAAVTGGQLDRGGRISCTGHFYPTQPEAYRCWIYKRHHVTHDDRFGHPLDGAEALMVSCNIFFFELGRRLAPRGLVDWYTRFGVGPEAVLPDIGLGDRGPDGSPRIFPGTLGRIGSRAGSLPSASEAVLMAIGQGPISWTPLQAADTYATLARMGLRIVPRLRSDVPPQEIDLGLDHWAIEQALKGLRLAVENPNGTGHHITIPMYEGPPRQEPVFNAPGITVWAKTGTADAAALYDEDQETGERIRLRHGDHSWSVLLCGASTDARPRYAVAVVVDYGGSGGRVAGPLSNQVIHALIAEGYLPGAKAPGGGAGSTAAAGGPREH